MDSIHGLAHTMSVIFATCRSSSCLPRGCGNLLCLEPRLGASSSVSDHLLSLRRLSLKGRQVAFVQAFLSWRREGFDISWTGTVRGGPFDELSFDNGEVTLQGETLDGRLVEGQAVVLLPYGPSTLLEIEGSGALRVDGRKL